MFSSGNCWVQVHEKDNSQFIHFHGTKCLTNHLINLNNCNGNDLKFWISSEILKNA
jgi:hypothetical protein